MDKREEKRKEQRLNSAKNKLIGYLMYLTSFTSGQCEKIADEIIVVGSYIRYVSNNDLAPEWGKHALFGNESTKSIMEKLVKDIQLKK